MLVTLLDNINFNHSEGVGRRITTSKPEVSMRATCDIEYRYLW